MIKMVVENLNLIIVIVFIAFISTIINNLVGGGFGTYITPSLLLLGFTTIEIIPPILLTHFLINSLMIFYNKVKKNENFKLTPNEKRMITFLVSFGILGLICSIFLVYYLPAIFIQVYIGFLTAVVGVLIILYHRKKKNYHLKSLLELQL